MTQEEFVKHITFTIVQRKDMCDAFQVTADFQFSVVHTFDSGSVKAILSGKAAEVMTEELFNRIIR